LKIKISQYKNFKIITEEVYLADNFTIGCIYFIFMLFLYPMRIPEITPYDPKDPYQRESFDPEYNYKMASQERQSAIISKTLNKVGAIVFTALIPTTLVVGHIKHLPNTEVRVICGVESLAAGASRRGIGIAQKDIERHGREMDAAAAAQLGLAEQYKADPHDWAVLHEPLSTRAVDVKPSRWI